MKYTTIPPSHGPHFAVPDVSGRDFYTAADRPALETLVHNLEHGYTILWYDGSKVKDTDPAQGRRRPGQQAQQSPPASSRSSSGTPAVARSPRASRTPSSHWAKDAGHRQLCGDLSGQAVVDFVKKYPASDTQEPGAQ